MGPKIGHLALALVAWVSSARADRSLGSRARNIDQTSGIHFRAIGAPDGRLVVMFFGNSLTAGLGLDPGEAYPALVQRKIDAAGLAFRVVNAGVSGATSADGVRRIDWVLKVPVAVFVLELGANDALRGQDLSSTRRNLQTILDRLRSKEPAARLVIAGMRAPPNLGRAYADQFRALFGELARANDAVLIDFLLAGVAGIDSLNQADGLHPNAAGARRVADTVWRVLEPLLRACPHQSSACRTSR